jgi:hypothetical protein
MKNVSIFISKKLVRSYNLHFCSLFNVWLKTDEFSYPFLLSICINITCHIALRKHHCVLMKVNKANDVLVLL